MELMKIFEENQKAAEPTNATLTVKTRDFAAAFRRIGPAVGKYRNILPILNCVLVTGTPRGLELTATDLDNRMTDLIPGDFPQVAFVLPYRVAQRFAASAKGENTYFFLENELKLVSGTARISIKTPDAGDFPAAAEIDGDEITMPDPALFLEDLANCARFASDDDSRRPLLGVMMCGTEPELTLAATDGKRLLIAQAGQFTMTRARNEVRKIEAIVPAADIVKLAAFFRKVRGPLTLTLNDKWIRFAAEGKAFSFKLIEGVYPNYNQVIPTSYVNRVILSGFAVEWGIRALGATNLQPHCKMTVAPNRLDFSYESPDGYSSAASVPAETLDADGDELCFNYHFLTQAARLGESIEMTWNDKSNPVTFTTGRYTAVIMPIRNR